MEELTANITKEEAIEYSIGFPVKPMRGKLIITVNVDEEDNELDLGGYGFAESQYVIAKGKQTYEDIKLGGRVLLDLNKLSIESKDPVTGEKILAISIKPIKVGDKVFGLINESVIDAIDER